MSLFLEFMDALRICLSDETMSESEVANFIDPLVVRLLNVMQKDYEDAELWRAVVRIMNEETMETLFKGSEIT